MPTFVWTDEVPERNRDWLTPNRRYAFDARDVHTGHIVDDEDDRILILPAGCAFLDGRAWNVETVADPAPPADPSAELERLRASIRAEIDWHEAMAKRLRASSNARHGRLYSVRAHAAAATRLRALLPQPTPEPEGK